MSKTDEPNLSELQIKIIQSIEHFSSIQQIKFKDNKFIQEKLGQVSEIRQEFRDFFEKSITHSLKIKSFADDLITLAESCNNDNVSDDVLLELSNESLKNSKENKKISNALKAQIEGIETKLVSISNEITKYGTEITERQEYLNDKIDSADKRTDKAISLMKGGLLATGIGTIAVLTAPFTAGASLVVFTTGASLAVSSAVPGAILGLGAFTFLGGAATTTVSLVQSAYYGSKDDRRTPQSLQEMRESLFGIQMIISFCKYYWGEQVAVIEDVIRTLTERIQLRASIAIIILAKANIIRTESENFSFNMQLALNRD